MTFKNMNKENTMQGGSKKFKYIDSINSPSEDKEHN